MFAFLDPARGNSTFHSLCRKKADINRRCGLALEGMQLSFYAVTTVDIQKGKGRGDPKASMNL